MKLSAIINAIEEFAPLPLQEKWDNSGLQIGLPDGNGEVTGVLICLDTTEEIVREAVAKGCNLIVSHHPLIFKGFKHLTGSTPQEAAAAAAIRAGVAVYSAHTSLDSTIGGVSYAMAARLGATVSGVIAPADVEYYTVRVICTRSQSSDVRLTLLGQTESCTYSDVEGESMAAPVGDFDPAAGLDLRHEPLTSVSIDIDSLRLGGALRALSGMTGAEIADLLRTTFGTACIKASAAYNPGMKVRRIALCGGSAPDFISRANAAGVDAYVTADVRYHDFADAANMSTVIFDIGHFESENCAKDIFYHVITKKFANFAVYKSEKETNPVKYL